MSSFQESQLVSSVNLIFQKYDTDKSNNLDFNQMRLLLSDAFQQFGATRPVSDQDIKTIISSVDKDHDYKITKNELLEIFKRLRDQN